MRLFARASEFDADRDALSWALGITSWEVRSWRRRQQRCREASTDAPPERAGELVRDDVARDAVDAAAVAEEGHVGVVGGLAHQLA